MRRAAQLATQALEQASQAAFDEVCAANEVLAARVLELENALRVAGLGEAVGVGARTDLVRRRMGVGEHCIWP